MKSTHENNKLKTPLFNLNKRGGLQAFAMVLIYTLVGFILLGLLWAGIKIIWGIIFG